MHGALIWLLARSKPPCKCCAQKSAIMQPYSHAMNLIWGMCTSFEVSMGLSDACSGGVR